jgi:hypothetical protein
VLSSKHEQKVMLARTEILATVLDTIMDALMRRGVDLVLAEH